MDTTLIIYDTITITELVIDTIAITQPPESFQIDLSSPSGGLITFLSESIQPIELVYDKKDVMDVSYFHKIQIFIIYVLMYFSITK